MQCPVSLNKILKSFIHLFLGFNLNSYLTARGYATTTPLNSLVASQLMEDLGVAHLLSAAQCQMSDPMFTSPTNGWTKNPGKIYCRKVIINFFLILSKENL